MFVYRVFVYYFSLSAIKLKLIKSFLFCFVLKIVKYNELFELNGSVINESVVNVDTNSGHIAKVCSTASLRKH